MDISNINNNLLLRHLDLKDAIAITVGVIIGAGIFVLPSKVAARTGSFEFMIAAWVVAGVISLCGALIFAELSSTFPYSGGVYVYQKLAFGRMPAFLAGWTFFLVYLSGEIAWLAAHFGSHVSSLLSIADQWSTLSAICFLAILTVINCIGIRPGKYAQLVTTVLKIGGIVGIIVAAFYNATPLRTHRHGLR